MIARATASVGRFSPLGPLGIFSPAYNPGCDHQHNAPNGEADIPKDHLCRQNEAGEKEEKGSASGHALR